MPCLGSFHFLDLALSVHPAYEDILRRIRSGVPFLDVGCGLGQDIRKLALDGAPTELLFGADLTKEYIDAGYDLFNDKDKFKGSFLAVDLFDERSALRQLRPFGVINSTNFLHMFDRDMQIRAATCLVKLLSVDKGSLIVGTMAGSILPGEKPIEGAFATLSQGKYKTTFKHDAATFTTLWEEVAHIVDAKFKIDVQLTKEVKGTEQIGGKEVRLYFNTPDIRTLVFTVERL